MNFYICSTPYHLFLSLCHMYTSEENGILYLTTHDSNSIEIFKSLEGKLRDSEVIDNVYLRKRNRIKEKLGLEGIKDRLEYSTLKDSLAGSCLYNFSWNPYSLYTPSNFLYKKAKDSVFIEESAILYACPKPSKLKSFIKRYLFRIKIDFYKDQKLKNILVQYPEKYPNSIQKKAQQFRVDYLFNRLNSTEKSAIINIFLSEKEKEMLNGLITNESVIILTQPLSEDGFVTSKEKYELYRDLVQKYGKNHKIIIKKHPREITKYGFEDVLELDGAFPSEVFTMLGIEFKKAIGICTGAINFINAEEKINTDENFLKRRKNNE